MFKRKSIEKYLKLLFEYLGTCRNILMQSKMFSQMGAGNNDNSNQGVGSVVGNANEVSGIQGTAQSKNS